MILRERYNKICSGFLFEVIANRYDISILIGVHIKHPFFEIKNQAIEVLHETSQ